MLLHFVVGHSFGNPANAEIVFEGPFVVEDAAKDALEAHLLNDGVPARVATLAEFPVALLAGAQRTVQEARAQVDEALRLLAEHRSGSEGTVSDWKHRALAAEAVLSEALLASDVSLGDDAELIEDGGSFAIVTGSGRGPSMGFIMAVAEAAQIIRGVAPDPVKIADSEGGE